MKTIALACLAAGLAGCVAVPVEPGVAYAAPGPVVVVPARPYYYGGYRHHYYGGRWHEWR